MPVTPNIIHTAKQIVNAQVVASRTMKLRTPDITPLQQSVDRNGELSAESTAVDGQPGDHSIGKRYAMTSLASLRFRKQNPDSA
jgi:hypothetical protein